MATIVAVAEMIAEGPDVLASAIGDDIAGDRHDDLLEGGLMAADMFAEALFVAVGLIMVHVAWKARIPHRLGLISPSTSTSSPSKKKTAPGAERPAPSLAPAPPAKKAPKIGSGGAGGAKVVEARASASAAGVSGQRLAEARGHALEVRTLLRSGRTGAALQRMTEMHSAGLEVPSRAFSELIQAAQAIGTPAVKEVINGLLSGNLGKVPQDAITAALTECLRQEDVALAHRLEALARGQLTAQQPAPALAMLEPLAKLYAKWDRPRASTLFQEICSRGASASEGLCGSLMARGGEAENVAFAEEVADYLRSRSKMTLATFKTLMKVYASNGLFEKACDLHAEILNAGIQPDGVMLGCLTKFAVRCGRKDLSEALISLNPTPDLQYFMLLIRTAGRESDCDKAIDALRQAEEMHADEVDSAVYNAALDVCATAGRMDLVNEVWEDVVRKGLANSVTFNTLVKGHCAAGDIAGARGMMKEMSTVGVKPDGAAYNCLLDAVVARDDCSTALDLLKEMDKKGVALDQYTVAIMMKVAKRARDPRDASRALATLDRVSVCEDEILFNSVLDACISRRDTDRLERVLGKVNSASALKPSVHTYGLLIKAYGVLKQPSKCRSLWRDMVKERGMTPSGIALSCMLDVLCIAGRVEEAVDLLKEWQDRVPANTVMYSTLIKGFASAGAPDRAMDIFRELSEAGHEMNLVSFTALIDAHARAGRMEEAEALFDRMQAEKCTPNVITYSTLVKGYCLQGDLESALRLFTSMLGSGLRADTVIFNTLLDGCAKHSRFELADQLLAFMGERGLQPSNYTLSIIVKLFSKRKQIDKAFEAVRATAKEHSRCLDPQVGSCLITACFHNKAADLAIGAFEEARLWPSCCGGGGSVGAPDVALYSALISGLARTGDCRRAAAYATEACEARMQQRPPVGGGRPLSIESLQLLFRALRLQGLSEELGAPLAQTLRLARMPVPEDETPQRGGGGGGFGGRGRGH